MFSMMLRLNAGERETYEGKSSGSESRIEPAMLLEGIYLLRVGVFLMGDDDPAIHPNNVPHKKKKAQTMSKH